MSTFCFLLVGCAANHADTVVRSDNVEPLPSWNDKEARTRIKDFVRRVTQEGAADFVPVKGRIATFDNDGTLWAEQPAVEEIFALERQKAYVEKYPALRAKQPFKAVLDKDKQYFAAIEPDAELKAVFEVLVTVYSNISREEFMKEAQEFYRTANYPKPAGPISQVAYQPMLELLTYLRVNGFQTWLCSGGTTDFMRILGRSYGIPPQQVIGTRVKQEHRDIDGRLAIWRKPAIESVNDKA